MAGFWSNIFKAQLLKGETEELLSSISLFKDFSKKELALITPIVHTRIYAAGEYIYNQGDPAIALYIIQEGEVILEKGLSESNKLLIRHLKKNGLFGEFSMFNDSRRTTSALASKESKIGVIFKADLDDFIIKYPKKGIFLLRELCNIAASAIIKLENDYVTLFLTTSASAKSKEAT